MPQTIPPSAAGDKPKSAHAGPSDFGNARWAVSRDFRAGRAAAASLSPVAIGTYADLWWGTYSNGLVSVGISQVAAAYGYTRKAVREALVDLRHAGLLLAIGGPGRPGEVGRYSVLPLADLARINPAAAADVRPLTAAESAAAEARVDRRAAGRAAKCARLGRAVTAAPAPAPGAEVLEPVETLAPSICAAAEAAWPGCRARYQSPAATHGWQVQVTSPGGAVGTLALSYGEPVARAGVLARLERAIAGLRRRDEEAPTPAPAPVQEDDGPLDFGPPGEPTEAVAGAACAEAEAAWPGCRATWGRNHDSPRLERRIWVTPPDGGARMSVALSDEDVTMRETVSRQVMQLVGQMRRAASAPPPEPKPAPPPEPKPAPAPVVAPAPVRPPSMGGGAARFGVAACGPSAAMLANWAAQAAESKAALEPAPSAEEVETAKIREAVLAALAQAGLARPAEPVAPAVAPAPAVEAVAPALGSAWSPPVGSDAAFGSPVAA